MFHLKSIRKRSKIISTTLLLCIINQLFFPLAALGYEGGVTQAEHNQASSTSNLVDPYTGEFNYNIPLMNMGGEYSISLNYNSSSVNMLAEPSAVGLGFNLSCFEQISRNTVEIPDDFKNDPIVTRGHVRPYHSVSINVGSINIEELAGFQNPVYPFPSSKNEKFLLQLAKKFDLNTVYWNNMKGLGVMMSSEGNIGRFSVSPRYDSQTGYGMNLGVNLGDKDTKWFGASLDYTAEEGLNSAGFRAYSGSLSFAKSRLSGVQLPMITTTANTIAKIGVGLHKGAGPLNGSKDKEKSNPDDMTEVPGKFTPISFIYSDPYVLDVTYSQSKVTNESILQNAIGYLYHENGFSSDSRKLVDYSREQKNHRQGSPFLPGSKPGKDIFIQSGASGGGSFTLIRNNIETLSPSAAKSDIINASTGFEFGNHELTDFHIGVDANTVTGETYYGAITENNKFFQQSSAVDKAYFKKTSEVNIETAFGNNIDAWGGITPQRVVLDKVGNYFKNQQRYELVSYIGKTLINANAEFLGNNQKFVRKNYIQHFTTNEAQEMGQTRAASYYSSNDQATLLNRAHHIAEINIFEGGKNLSYGFPVYNKSRKDVVVSLDHDDVLNFGLSTNSIVIPAKNKNGTQVKYGKAGLLGQEYLKEVSLPPYATAWLLHSIKSDDYVDVDRNGKPTSKDRGNWVVFDYDYTTSSDQEGFGGTYIANYKWRTPYKDADLIQGVKGLTTDDMLTYSSGEREVVYLKTIKTRTHKAEFYYSKRLDAYQVKDPLTGGIDYTNPNLKGNSLFKLDKIVLYLLKTDVKNPVTESEYTHVQTTTFEYDYSLCPNVPSNSGEVDGTLDKNKNKNRGKLTLKKVYSRFYNSTKGQNYSYEFNYGIEDQINNPKYNRMNIDRWGEFKRNFDQNGSEVYSSNYPFADFPYSDQSITVNAPWKLKEIILPNGSLMNITYEPHDYAFVEDHPAVQMFDIVSMDDIGSSIDLSNFEKREKLNYVQSLIDKEHLVVNIGSIPILKGDLTSKANYFYTNFLKGIENQLYMKVYTKLSGTSIDAESYKVIDESNSESNSDYVELVASIEGYSVVEIGDKNYGVIKLKKRSSSGVSQKLNPIRFAAIEHIKNSRDEFINGIPKSVMPDINILITDGLTKAADALTGVTSRLLLQGCASSWRANGWSVVALKSPNGNKIGGGWRVKEISLKDNWKNININDNQNYEYKQEYIYTINETNDHSSRIISSGVAYEPMMGSEENANTDFYEFTEPVLSFEQKYGFIKGTPLDLHMPGASVGYRKVVVKNKYPDNVAIEKSRAPYTIYEFNTPKDFPVIKDYSKIMGDDLPALSFNNSFADLYAITSSDRTYSQGFTLIKNNMGGTLKKITELTNGYTDLSNPNNNIQPAIISEQEYVYQTSELSSKEGNINPLEGKFSSMTQSKMAISNQVNALKPDRTIEKRVLGEQYDIWVDALELKQTIDGEEGLTNDLGVVISHPFLKYPMLVPNKKQIETESVEKYMVVNKIITRSGVIDHVITRKDNSKIQTDYLAYDNVYGNVIFTKVQNEFKFDQNIGNIYKLSIPGYWHYPKFEGKFKNQDFTEFTLNSVNETYSYSPNVLISGDLIYYEALNGGIRRQAYVECQNVDCSQFTIEDKLGNRVSGQIEDIRIINSGNTNYNDVQLGQEVAQNSNFDPLAIGEYVLNLSNHINLSAISYKDEWPGICCLISSVPNPYENRSKNNWKPHKSFVYNVKRSYTNTGNTVKDGLILNYTAFQWKNPNPNSNPNWTIESANPNWILASEATRYGLDGELKEQKDANGLYSTSFSGYDGNATRAVTTNSGFKESIFDGFEEYEYTKCFVDGDLDLDEIISNVVNNALDKDYKHTGKYSLKINPGQNILIKTVILNCNE